MNHGEREQSRTYGAPIALYLFKGTEQSEEAIAAAGFDHGAFGPFAFTDAEDAITRTEIGFDEPVVYVPWPVDRGNIVSSGSLDKSQLKVSMAEGSDLAALFLEYPPAQVVNLIIRDGHVGDDPDDPACFPVVWTGRVLGCGHPPLKTEFTCEPISTSGRRPGLRRNYQISCPHVLYGPDCRADRDAATIERTVAGVERTRVTLSTGWDSVHPHGKYVGGMIRWTRPGGFMELRSILRCADGVTLRLSGTTRGLQVGDTVKLILGCSRSITQSGATIAGDCVDLHDNIHNYGGQPFIPLTNPLGPVNNFD